MRRRFILLEALKFSYSVTVREYPELGQDVAISLGVKNKSEVEVYFDWKAARIRSDNKVIVPTKRGFTTTFAAPEVGPWVVSPGIQEWEWIMFQDTARVFSANSCIVEAEVFRNENGKILHAVPEFTIRKGDLYKL